VAGVRVSPPAAEASKWEEEVEEEVLSRSGKI